MRRWSNGFGFSSWRAMAISKYSWLGLMSYFSLINNGCLHLNCLLSNQSPSGSYSSMKPINVFRQWPSSFYSLISASDRGAPTRWNYQQWWLLRRGVRPDMFVRECLNWGQMPAVWHASSISTGFVISLICRGNRYLPLKWKVISWPLPLVK